MHLRHAVAAAPAKQTRLEVFFSEGARRRGAGFSPAGNSTRVYRVTGGDTNHYTTGDGRHAREGHLLLFAHFTTLAALRQPPRSYVHVPLLHPPL